MKVVETVSEMREWSRDRRHAGRKVGLVPTLGYLHEGHMSLVDSARSRADEIILSIFVNPLQFGPGEDFEAYPRDRERDLAMAREAGLDVAFLPSGREMYPEGDPWISVVPDRGADVLCGQFRPGHFRGVLTVVAKLFGVCEPDVAVFGRKDFQQLTLIRRMARDLNMGIEIVGAPIVREADGLAMSSRNKYLSPDERRKALRISNALERCRALYERGETSPDPYRTTMAAIEGEGVTVQYAEIVDPDTLAPVDPVQQGSVCAIAAFVGSTRLIDNVSLSSDPLAAE